MKLRCAVGALSVVVAPLLVACGPPKTVRDLSTPVYEWAVERGGCGKSLIADGHADLWLEEGCEGKSSGMRVIRHLTPSEMARIVDSFGSLPQRDPVVCTDNANSHMFFRRKDDVASVWHVCLPAEETPLPEPFAEIGRAFGGKR